MYAGSSSVVRRWLEPPYDLDGWRVDVANMTGRLGADDFLPDVARGVRGAVTADAVGRARRRRARARRARRSRLGALARLHELRGLHPPGVDLAARREPSGGSRERVHRTSRRRPAASRRGDGPDDARVPCRHSVDRLAPLVVDPGQPRLGSLPRHRRLARASARRRRPADDDAGRADGLRRRRDRSRGRLGRGRAPDDAVVSPRDVGHGRARRLPEPHRAATRKSRALARGIRYAHVSADAIAYVREARDEAVLCLAARGSHEPVRLSLGALGAQELETLAGEDVSVDGDHVVLPPMGRRSTPGES